MSSSVERLASSTAVTAAVAMAEYASFYDLLIEAREVTEEEHRSLMESLKKLVQEQALMLLLLARSISEYNGQIEISQEDDPRLALPLIQEIGASYAIVALTEDGSNVETSLLLSPGRLEEILTPELAAFISKWGEKEAIKILAERKKLYEDMLKNQ